MTGAEADAVLAVMARQRACREFAPDPVDDATVERLLTAATHAPSAENAQPWEFVVVRDAATRAAIAAIGRRAWEGGGRAASRDRLGPSVLADVDAGMAGGFAAAPVTIVVGADLRRGRRAAVGSSIFPAVQNLLLAATASGLGSALTTIATAGASELAALLALPDDVVPVAVVPLGRPARTLGPPRREPARARTHRERYGEAW